MADHFEMDGIADYSIISGLQTTFQHQFSARILSADFERRFQHRFQRARLLYSTQNDGVALCVPSPLSLVGGFFQGFWRSRFFMFDRVPLL